MKYFCVGYGKQTIYMWNNKRRKLLWNISTLLLNRTLWVTCCLQAVQTFSVIINIFLDYWVRTRSHTLCKLQTAGFIMHHTAMPESCTQTHLRNCHEVNCTCTCSSLLHRSSFPVHHHFNPAKNLKYEPQSGWFVLPLHNCCTTSCCTDWNVMHNAKYNDAKIN